MTTILKIIVASILVLALGAQSLEVPMNKHSNLTQQKSSSHADHNKPTE